MRLLEHLKHRLQGKIPAGSKRSGEWPTVRKRHLEKFPYCMVCGSKKNLEVHHIEPFHLNPSRELDPENLITLCESKGEGINCHLLVGHLGSFKSLNSEVVQDAMRWNKKLKDRP
jgi:5-methylcytosine-specific restriction enzyme A